MSGEGQRDHDSRSDECEDPLSPVIASSLLEVLTALLRGTCLSVVVPIALARVERDPLVHAAHFSGDLMRGLMEVPGAFWGRHPLLFDRYREALRRSAAHRRRLPPEERMRFWSPLPRAPEEEVGG